MSEMRPADHFEGAARVPSWTKPPESQGFTPWSSYSAAMESRDDDAPAAPIVAEILDPAKLRAEAFTEGFNQGRVTVEAEVAAERRAIAQLAEALDALQPEPPHALARLLAETVERLVRQIVGEVTIDTDSLLARASAAAELIADEAAPSRMRLHPADLERLKGARLDLEMIADAHLPEGTILIETGEGWIEDGTEARLDHLRAALDKIGVPR